MCLFKVGDLLECTNDVSSTKLDMFNDEFTIRKGDKVVIRDMIGEQFSTCAWYSLQDIHRTFVINAYEYGDSNNPVSDNFKRVLIGE